MAWSGKVEAVSERFSVDYAALVESATADCHLVILSDTTLRLALSLGRFLRWQTRWVNHPGLPGPNFPTGHGPIDDLIHTYFAELAMGCNANDLINAINRLRSAVAGEKLTIITPTGSIVYDYTETGLTPRLESPLTNVVIKLGELRAMQEMRSVAETTAANTRSNLEQAVLGQVRDAINNLDPYDDADLVAKLGELRTMLETRMVAETTAANTRNTALIKAIGEIDAATTVNLNNSNGCGDGGDCGGCEGDSFSVQLQE